PAGQCLFLPRLRLPARPGRRRAPRRGRGADPAGPAGYPCGAAGRAHPVPPAAARRGAHPRVLHPSVPRQGRGGGRRLGHGRLQQPGSAEPVAQPRGQPGGARPRLRRHPGGLPAAAVGAPLRSGDAGRPRPPPALAGAAAAAVPRAAPFPALGRVAAGAHPVGGDPGRARAREGGRNGPPLAGGAAAMSARRRLLLRLLTLAVLGVVAVLLLRLARQTDWAAVAAALRGYGAGTLATALALVAASYALYCGYELLARRQVGHRVGTRRTVCIALVSYAFSLNFGALVGGGGMRLRLYRGAGLAGGPIARVALYAVTTNWIGYCLLAGMVLASARLPLPGGVAPEAAWRVLGAAMLLLVAAC